MRRFAFLTLLGLASAGAQAAVIYKLVDPAGNVTLADVVPPGFRGEITRIDVDTTTMPTRPTIDIAKESVKHDAELASRRLAEVRRDEQITAARSRLDAALAKLESAQSNSVSEDWIYYRQNPVTGAQRMPSPEYAQRLSQLEGEVLAAQSALDNLERNAR